MKIQKKEASKVFQPITLEITIESEDEFDALKTLCGFDSVVAAHLFDEGYIEERSPIEEILTNIWKVLN